ncbi:hypothetical protein PHJA_000481000 [Phtheirospermum japonicum]|uniref:COP1-interacting protein 7 n=1 Tax=Phtheirospermum japonicum TaxID=374723 RepID=A0A830B8N0_9LAMI|nr:hypothetical protein PHJA_000481000 [Phtheirospermum japonicum]
MKPNTRLSSVVFQLTPTRTRCDLIIIANDKKEKIASGLLNPFLAHLKTAQDQIAKGGYSILLEPDTDAAWFTKATLERFVRFVSTPEILERVCTIETEILHIEEAMAMQSSNDIGQSIVEDYQDKPLGGCEDDKSACNANEEKAIVLYKPEASLPEVNGSCLEEGNSKVQLLKVLETRKTVLQKEQGMAFARAAAAGFSIDHMEPLASFAEFFGAFRLMEACSRFVDLWKSKQETGEWVDIEASETLLTQSDFSIMNASGGVLSATNNNHVESNHERASEDNGKSGSTYSADNPVPIGQQANFQGQFPHIMFPPWPMHAPPGAPPVFQAYPVQGMPYYPTYTTSGPFFPPPQHPMEHSQSNIGHQSGQKMQSLDGRDSNTKSNKKQSGMLVIQNINYVASKENKSGSELDTDSDSDIDAEDDDHDAIHSKSKGNNLRGIDDGNWQAFQNCLLRGSEEDAHASNEGMFAMEKNAVIKRRANISSLNDLEFSAGDTREFCDEIDIQFAETNGRKVLSRSTHEDFNIGSQQNKTIFRNSSDPLMVDNFDAAICKTDGKSVYGMSDETFIVPFRSVSIDEAGQEDRNVIDVDSEIPLSDKKLDSEGDRNKAYYEPDNLSMMPERGTENRLVEYDPALDYEMQVSVERSEDKGGKGVTEVKGGLKKTEKQRTGGPLMKGRPSKMSPPEDARARAEKLRSYKADLQKLKKEKDEAEAKRIEALKLERQKRIAARGGPTSGKPSVLSPQTKPFPAKLSPVSKSKFSDAEPGTSSPLQRSKIRTSLGSREPLKAVSKGTKLSGVSHLAGNRLTRSSSSLSETRRESNGGRTPDSKASVSQIRRLSEPKRAVSKPGLSEGNKISAIINLDKSKAATLPELKIKTSKSHVSTGDSDADDNTIVEKTVVMLEYEKPSLPTLQDSEGKLELRYDDREKGKKSDVISEFAPIHAPPSSMDAVDRDPMIRHLQTKCNSDEVSAACPEKNAPNFANISTAVKSYQDETVQAHHVPYGKTLKMDKNPVTSDKKTLAKESSKGLRRLLKFGKKNHSSSNLSFDSNCTSVDGTEHNDDARHTASTSEVHTIKNLISQDETSTDGKASRKISHHFSLFSPFRSKTNEKKRAS